MKFFYVSENVHVRPFSGGTPKEYVPFVNAFRKTLDIIAPIK